jgi:hypothetical protein
MRERELMEKRKWVFEGSILSNCSHITYEHTQQVQKWSIKKEKEKVVTWQQKKERKKEKKDRKKKRYVPWFLVPVLVVWSPPDWTIPWLSRSLASGNISNHPHGSLS